MHSAPGESDTLACPATIMSAIHDIEISIFIEICCVARVHPTATERLLGLLRLAPITFHDIGASDYYLAHFARRQRPIVGVQEAADILQHPVSVNSINLSLAAKIAMRRLLAIPVFF